MHPLLQQIILTPGLEQETRDWLARVHAAGGVVGFRGRTAANRFIRDAKRAGIFTLFRRLNLCCGDFLSSFVPVVNTSGGAADTNNAILTTDYDQSLGWQTDGSTKFIDTGYTPTEATGGISVYLRTAVGSGNVVIGCRDAGSTQIFRLNQSAGTNNQGTWGGINVAQVASATMAAGLWSNSRLSTTDLQIYFNAVTQNTQGTLTVAATPSQTVYVFCQNAGGSTSGFCASGTRIGGYAIDTGMTAAQMALYYGIMQRFQAELGRSV